jgi:hypothetical protein
MDPNPNPSNAQLVPCQVKELREGSFFIFED